MSLVAVGQLWAHLGPHEHQRRLLRITAPIPPLRVAAQIVRRGHHELRFPRRRLVRLAMSALATSSYVLLEERPWRSFYLDLGSACPQAVTRRLERDVGIAGSRGRYIDSLEDFRDLIQQAGVVHDAKVRFARHAGVYGPHCVPYFVVWPGSRPTHRHGAPVRDLTDQTLEEWAVQSGLDLDWRTRPCPRLVSKDYERSEEKISDIS